MPERCSSISFIPKAGRHARDFVQLWVDFVAACVELDVFAVSSVGLHSSYLQLYLQSNYLQYLQEQNENWKHQ